ncbi:MAG TPA: hypothetical protein VEV15_04225, partial [Flavisolibacter sp.]|nr:hypothetical protein [Flavisolibacter sp.]
MKRNFTNENFEDFLRQSADGLRLRPSGKVWKNISKHLNKRRRRVGFAIGTFLLAVSTFAYFIVQDSAKKFNSLANANPAATTPATKKVFEKEITAPNSVQKTAILNTPHHAQPFSKTNFKPANTYHLPQPFENNPSETKITPDVTSNGNGTAIAGFTPTVVDSYSDQPAEDKIKNQGSVVNDKPVTYPLTIESVVNSYKTKNSKKTSLQFYFTPTISYRKLSENKSFLRSQTATNPNYWPALIFDVNNMVTHKPNIGFELGMAVKYPLTQKMKLRGGIQFNVNRYD